MVRKRDELRDELVVLLRAGRELDPETDPELAETFLAGMERRVKRRSRPTWPLWALAGTLLLGAGWLGIPMSLTAQRGPVPCSEMATARYPSMRALKRDAPSMRRHGLHPTGVHRLRSGVIETQWAGTCR
jgi:hypothetical protein